MTNQKLKVWQNSNRKYDNPKTQIVNKPESCENSKKSKCDKTQIVTKLQNSIRCTVLEKMRLARQKGPKNLDPFYSFSWFFVRTVYVHKVFEGLYDVSWSTEFNDKETGFVLSTILENIWKNCKKGPILLDLFYGQVSFFQERSIEMSSGFLRCNQCIKTLHLSYQMALSDDFKFSL